MTFIEKEISQAAVDNFRSWLDEEEGEDEED